MLLSYNSESGANVAIVCAANMQLIDQEFTDTS